MNRHKDGSKPELIRPVEARQGVTGHHVIRVLAVGLFLAIGAGVVLFFTVGN